MDFTSLFCSVDDFCQDFEPTWRQQQISSGQRQRQRSSRMCTSEILTILIAFHSSNIRTFKHYYLMLLQNHRCDFPTLLSYSRFVRLIPRMLGPGAAYLHSRFGACTGIAFIDSTALAVCSNKRIGRHRVFEGIAKRGKTSMGWFFGFKLHLVVNECGELLAVRLTPGNTDDRVPVPEMVEHLHGKLFGDKGYISASLFKELYEQELQLITPIRRNMKNRLMPVMDKLLLRKRSLIETINDQLKNIAQIEHTRHRSPANFAIHLLAGLTSYCHQEKKPRLRLAQSEREDLHEMVQLLNHQQNLVLPFVE